MEIVGWNVRKENDNENIRSETMHSKEIKLSDH